jgi:hypothetical protein
MIENLPNKVKRLKPSDKALFNRIFSVSLGVGRVIPPKSMHSWIKKSFKSVSNVKSQKVIKVTNNLLNEGALYNSIRSMRPMQVRDKSNVEKVIKETEGDPFCKPLKLTPANSFGRVRGKHCITCANVAVYDAWHGVVVFKRHDPLKFSLPEVKDYVNTALNLVSFPVVELFVEGCCQHCSWPYADGCW